MAPRILWEPAWKEVKCQLQNLFRAGCCLNAEKDAVMTIHQKDSGHSARFRANFPVTAKQDGYREGCGYISCQTKPLGALLGKFGDGHNSLRRINLFGRHGGGWNPTQCREFPYSLSILIRKVFLGIGRVDYMYKYVCVHVYLELCYRDFQGVGMFCFWVLVIWMYLAYENAASYILRYVLICYSFYPFIILQYIYAVYIFIYIYIKMFLKRMKQVN